MSDFFKNFIAGVIGTTLVLSGLLTLILGFLYVRDGMSTAVPVLMWSSVAFFAITALLTWRFKRVRRWLVIDVFSWIFPW